MRIRFDNILLSFLWLLVVTLGTCFWFNIAFGFDIFSSTHWGYVASMQASQNPIKPAFYISVAAVIFITIFGLYLIVRPRRRRIKLPVAQTATTPQNIAFQQNNAASTIDILPAEMQPATMKPTPVNTAPSATARPPRLNIPIPSHPVMPPSPTPTQTAPQPSPTPQSAPSSDWPELREIFTNAGYIIKPTPRVNGIQTALVAIGTDEVMWIGCVGVATTAVRAIIDKFNQIFTDTLDETEIDIHGFAIAAPDAATSEFTDILMFDTPSALREYINENPNPPLPDDDDGMFDAFSEYIDAVINHIGKI